jgi:hypothetical protein
MIGVGAALAGAAQPLELPGPTEELAGAPAISTRPTVPRPRQLELETQNKRRRRAVISLVLIAALLVCSGVYLLTSAGNHQFLGANGLSNLFPFAGQSTGTATSANSGTGANNTVTPGGSSGGGATVTVGSGTPPSSTVTPGGPTVTPQPTATAVPGAFSVSEVDIQQQCTLVLALPSFTVTLYNQTGGPVGYQTTIVSTVPGSSTPWASASPASGTIPAGGSQQVVITPNSGLCSDQLLRGTQSFTLTIAAVSGATGTFTVTDAVTGLL